MNAKSKKRFIQVTKRGTITVICPNCEQHFGLDPQFVEKVSEVAYKFACPYCGERNLLNDA